MGQDSPGVKREKRSEDSNSTECEEEKLESVKEPVKSSGERQHVLSLCLMRKKFPLRAGDLQCQMFQR